MSNNQLTRLELRSPFALYGNESLIDEKSEEFGHFIELNEFQAELIKAVNVMLFATRQLLKKYLAIQGIHFSDKMLTKQLKRLSLHNYLRKKSFVSLNGRKSGFMTYMLDRKGKGFLRHMGIRIKLEGYINEKTPGEVKKILAANQAAIEIIIAGGDKKMYFETARIFLVNEKRLKANGHLFRALGFINNEDGGKSYFIQPVRNGQDDIVELLDKLNRMEQVIQIAGFSELSIQEDITVIVVAESKIEMEHIKTLLENKQKLYGHLQLATTYDRLIISEDLPLEKRIYLLPGK